MQARLPGERHEHVLPFWQPTLVRGLAVTLLPAGHIFGSAQFFLETDAGSLLYTGDFKLRRGRSAEAAEWKRADTLIMETTYGLPRYRLPPTELVVQQIVAFCREALEEGATPVLLGYSLGKAQEILCSLAEANLQPMLHGSVYRMTRIYEQFGQAFCQYERYDAKAVAGKVLICPPSANRSRMMERIPNKRVAMISGWAVEPNAIYRYQVDAAFPLSDHADYDDLLRYVELVQPQRVLTLHGFAAEFARDLRDRGIEAWALTQQNQLELPLRSAPPPGSAPVTDAGRGVPPQRTSRNARVTSEQLRLRKSSRRRGRRRQRSRRARYPVGIRRVRRSRRTNRRHARETAEGPIALRIPAHPRPRATARRRDFPDRKAVRPNRPADGPDWLGDHLSRAPRSEPARQCRAASNREQPRRREQGRFRSARRANRARAVFVRRSAGVLFEELHKTRGPAGKTELLQARLAKALAARGAVCRQDSHGRPAHRPARRAG